MPPLFNFRTAVVDSAGRWLSCPHDGDIDIDDRGGPPGPGFVFPIKGVQNR